MSNVKRIYYNLADGRKRYSCQIDDSITPWSDIELKKLARSFAHWDVKITTDLKILLPDGKILQRLGYETIDVIGYEIEDFDAPLTEGVLC